LDRIIRFLRQIHTLFVADTLRQIRFTLANRTSNNHTTLLRTVGLPAGGYDVHLNGELIEQITSKANAWVSANLPIVVDTCEVKIQVTNAGKRSDLDDRDKPTQSDTS
jgi:hypothetical protein